MYDIFKIINYYIVINNILSKFMQQNCHASYQHINAKKGHSLKDFSFKKVPSIHNINIILLLLECDHQGSERSSLIAAESVRSIHILSIPNPIPPVGGIPISSAFRKSSSVVFASSSPCASNSSCALKRAL